MEFIDVSYRIEAEESRALRIARAIAVEQTVEVPPSLITPAIEESIVGQLVDLRPAGAGKDTTPLQPRPVQKSSPTSPAQLALIRYSAHLVAGELPRLLNLVYGNTSMQDGIRVMELRLPPSVLAAFRGPRFGVEGIRRLLGVYGRPLLASALKPNGAPVEHFEAIARDFALGGGDIIKDDQNLLDEDFSAWRERVTRCHEATEQANAKTGRRCLYLPYLSGRVEEAPRRLETLLELGIRGYLVAPFLLGLETARGLAERYPLLAAAHPSLSGPYYLSPRMGMDAGLVLGTFMRLAGMDISIFVNAGGRFSFDRQVCATIAQRLREPLGRLPPSLPSPAGGMSLDNLEQMTADYGQDACLLIGGALLSHSDDLSSSTRHFLDLIRDHFDERLEDPDDSFVDASCEWPDARTVHRVLHHLSHRGDFHWEGRSFVDYKANDALPFSGVRRLELIGHAGERTSFELRYFEVEPGGFSSLEKHRHTHVLIGVRGRGILVRGDETSELFPLDVAYIDSLVTHQLKNATTETFGFFCIVDRERDRPMQP